MTLSDLKLTDPQRALLIRVVEHAKRGGNGVFVKGQGRRMTAEVLRRHNLVRGTIELFPQIDGNKLVESWRCGNCGHLEYHCPASGCNHFDPVNGGSDCDCEDFVKKVMPC